MRAALFVVFLIYVVLLIIRPQEFVPALQQVPILQYTLLGAFALWLATRDKGLKYPQFKLLLPFLVVAWIGMGLSGWWGGIIEDPDSGNSADLPVYNGLRCRAQRATAPHIHVAARGLRVRTGPARPLAAGRRDRMDRRRQSRGGSPIPESSMTLTTWGCCSWSVSPAPSTCRTRRHRRSLDSR